jgi:predicted metal-dependent phosphoesterase TrpH
MKIDLHIHTKDCSDGAFTLEQIFSEAKSREIDLMSITDHDSVDCQERAIQLAEVHGIRYVTGVELGIAFSHPDYREGRSASLDILSYGYDHRNVAVKEKLVEIREYRETRALKILELINSEFESEGREPFTDQDMENIKRTADGSLGRPHIGDYMVEKGIAASRQEAFDKYLERCNVKKYPFNMGDAARLMKAAGGIMVLAHPNIRGSPSLNRFTSDLEAQTRIIEETMLEHLDGIECWHTRLDEESSKHYQAFAKKHDLIATGGSDCHQDPVLMGTVDVPEWVGEQDVLKIQP